MPSEQQRLSPLPLLERWEKAGKGELRLDNRAFQAKLAELCPALPPQLDQDYLQRCLLQPWSAPIA